MKRDGTGVVEDRWITAYAPPAADASSDIDDFSIKREDGRSVLKFRKRVSNAGDAKNDVDLSKDLHLLFPVSGGPVFGSFVGKHTATPIVSPNKISLLATCGGSAEAGAESEAEAEAEAEAESEAEAEAEAEGEAGGSSKYTPKGAMHAMNCADIVIGMARGTASKVFDAYTRDRSTPMADKVKSVISVNTLKLIKSGRNFQGCLWGSPRACAKNFVMFGPQGLEIWDQKYCTLTSSSRGT